MVSKMLPAAPAAVNKPSKLGPAWPRAKAPIKIAKNTWKGRKYNRQENKLQGRGNTEDLIQLDLVLTAKPRAHFTANNFTGENHGKYM